MVHEGAVVGRVWTPVLNPGKWFKLSFIYNKVRLRKKTPGRDDRGEGVGLGGGGTQVEAGSGISSGRIRTKWNKSR